MYCRITLYKSGFDPQNVFVGTDKQARETALATLPKMELPVSAYNPNRPFRIVGNFLQFDRVYDYLKYELAESSDMSNSWVRFYFVLKFRFVNDTETDIITQADMLGTVFHDLKFSRLEPERFTFKSAANVESPDNNLRFSESEFSNHLYNYLNSRPVDDAPEYNGFNAESEFGRISNTAEAWAIGFIVNVSSGDKVPNYTENHLIYPLGVTLIPFIYDYITRLPVLYDPTINELFTFAYKAPSAQFVKTISGIEKFNQYFTQSGDFHFIDNFVWLGCNLLKARYSTLVEGEIIIELNGEVPESFIDTYNPESPNLNSFLCIVNNNIDELAMSETLKELPTLPIRNNDPDFFKQPFYNLRVQVGNDYLDIDPAIIPEIFYYDVPQEKISGELFLFQSLIPPFPIVVIPNGYQFIEAKSDFRTYLLSMDSALMFTPHKPFFSYSDSYAEFLRTNYNSTITGLKVRQQAEWQGYGVNLAGTGLKMIASGAMGDGAGLASAVGGVIDSATKGANLAINQEKERALLDLKLADIQNQADTVALNGSLAQVIETAGGIRAFVGVIPNLDFYKRYYKAFGFKTPRGENILINSIRQHVNFDYLKVTDFTLAQDSIKLTQSEVVELTQELNAGIRLWYSLANYKNFDAANNEIN